MRVQSCALAIGLCLIVALTACGGGTSNNPPPPPPANFALTQIASGLTTPVDLQQSDDGSGRFFVVEQPGTIKVVQGTSVLPTAFLDIRSKVSFSPGGEMGLLGVAFHPNYSTNHRFYVNYDRTLGSGQIQTVIAEYQAPSAASNQADATSERILLTVDQPFTNHKGGQLSFGPDGFLYIALGDGGSGGDPSGNGQNLNMLLGKMLRIDADGALPYAIPPSNPFASGGGLPEIWAYGLRNPFRFSFDRTSGKLFAGDVGQDAFEEVDILASGGNFGWNTMEGMHCFNPSSGCDMTGLTLPIAEYGHSEGEAVIGGYVYHGAAIPSLAGVYVFGDFITGRMWTLTQSAGGAWTRKLILSTGRGISSFGQDAAGEIYVVDYSGVILKLEAQ